jgi:cell division septum initiation protein DivIVA
MPPLGLLADVAAGRIVPEMSEVLALTDALTAELPKMLEEHSRIKAALGELERAAEEQKLPDLAEFARKLVLHARTEEDVLYPAAIILGDYLKAKLASAQAASGAAGQQS